MRVYELNEKLKCKCGHTWEDHHHGCVMNMEYVDYPLNINGCIAQECEHDQVNGEYFVSRDTACMCPNFRPAARNVQKLVDEWVRKHEEMRKHGR